MKCFYSSEADAVGICRSCGRALCRDHLVEFDKGLACRGRCEDDVKALIEITAHGAVAKAGREFIGVSSFGPAWFLIVAGLGFGVMGVGIADGFLMFLGLLFVVFGIWLLIQAVRLRRLAAQGKENPA